MDWTMELTLEFISLYEKESCIWHPKHPQHKNRPAVTEAWKRIAESMSIECTVDDLKKKKESLMTGFRTICVKEKASLKSGIPFKPNWFAYKPLSFLRDFYLPISTIKAELCEDPLNVEDNNSNSRDERPTYRLENTETIVMPQTPESNLRRPYAGKKRKPQSDGDGVESCMQEAYNIIKSIHKEKKQKDVCSLYGELIVAKLRTFDDMSRDVLMNEIDNLIFRFTTTHRSKSSQQSLATTTTYTSAGSSHSQQAAEGSDNEQNNLSLPIFENIS